MAEYFWMKQLDGEWYQMLTINLHAEEAEVIEWMQTVENETIWGRTLTVEDTTAFLHSYAVKSESDFESLMEKKNEKGLLTLDNIHRHCERHCLKYKIEGLPLGAAKREYRKEILAHEQEKLKKAWESYDKGVELLYDKNRTDRDINQGLWLLTEAAAGGCEIANGRLAFYYWSKHQRGDAAYAARIGASQGDPLSMYVLSELYREGADFENLTNLPTEKPNMEKAVEWCLKSARGGWRRAMRRLNEYIHAGLLVPDTKLYLELLILQGKFNTMIKLRERT
ncbi:MAG: hypothetical protein NC453_11480 [Muribaculum sp.]|nr:hypothetical protein [Muribaculum sp.]